MKVLMVSRVFPTTHPRGGCFTRFKSKFFNGEKIHTIRANTKGHFKDGDEVSVRNWTGRPYGSKQVEICQRVIHLERIELVKEDGFVRPLLASGERIHVSQFARNDGLSTEDFVNWFFPKAGDGRFVGDILHFTTFRYAIAETKTCESCHSTGYPLNAVVCAQCGSRLDADEVPGLNGVEQRKAMLAALGKK